MSRFQEVARTIPPSTLGAIVVNSSMFLLQMIFVTDKDLQNYTLCSRSVIYDHQVYRIVTSALFHGNLMHIGMNMMSLSAIGPMLERRLGTMRMFCTIIWSILLTALLHILACWVLYVGTGIIGPFVGHSIGFSGVIFHLSVLECNLGTHQSRSLFGVLEVPSYLYPWALLLVLQLIMPNLSFGGHLSGIVIGTLQLHGLLGGLMPKEHTLKSLESSSWMRWLASWPSFVATTSNESVVARGEASMRQGVNRGFWLLCSYVFDIAEKIKVAIFGRGIRTNENIQLGLWNPESHEVSDYNEDDDDSWSGLPATASQIV